MTLRDYQIEDAAKIKARWIAGVNRQLLKWATGAGKSVLFASLPDQLSFSGRMMVLDHRTELTDQALGHLRRGNPGRTVGAEMGERRSNGEQLIVAGNATIGRKDSPRLLQFNPADFDVLVVDEAHRAVAQSYRTVINHFLQNPKLLLLGVTATPSRADGRGLGEIFQEIVADRDILWGIKNGWLVDLRGIRIKTGVNIDGVASNSIDFEQGALGTALNTVARNKLVATSWLEHCAGRRSVGFSAGVQHARDLAAALRQHGVAAEGIWGEDEDRASKLERHRAGELTVLFCDQLLSEGYDDPEVSCIIMAATTKSEGRFTQEIGRGTRIPFGVENLLTAKKAGNYTGKLDCIVLDFVDSTTKHSLVTLPTLFGLGQDTNLRGKPITQVLAEIDDAKQKNPLLDVTRVEDVTQIESYAEQVDLFKVTFPPEIIQISEYQWHRTGHDAYVLALLHNESVTVMQDLLGFWHIVGMVNENVIRDKRDTFEQAIREADWKVGILGGRTLKMLIKRKAKWHKDPPSPQQRDLCRKLGIVIPPLATKGDVAAKMTKVLLERKSSGLSEVGGRATGYVESRRSNVA